MKLTGPDGTEITLRPGAEKVVDHRSGVDGGTVLAYHQRGGDGDVTFRQGEDGVWHEEQQSAIRFEVELAELNGRPDLAETLTKIADRSLDQATPEQLTDLLHNGSTEDARAAVYEIVLRGSGKSLRWTQLDAVDAFGERDFVQMSAGEGKSWVFFSHAVVAAVHSPGKVAQVITTRDSLAGREYTEYLHLLEPHGVHVLRIKEDEANVQPVGEDSQVQPTVFIGTVGNLAFARLKENEVPGDRAFLDEVDEAVVFTTGEFILAHGAGLKAPPEVVRGVQFAKSVLDLALDRALLDPSHFGRTADTPKAPTRLTDEGREIVQDLVGRDLDAMELARIEMAATAKWDYVSEDHYLVFQDKVLIIDQSTHKVMYDAEKSSESRWHGDLANGIPSLAQAVEAKHGLPIRADIDSNARVSTIELFEPKSAGGSGRYDHVTGASGTARGHEDVFQKYSSAENVKVREIPEYYTSQLNGQDKFFADKEAKLDTLAADATALYADGEGPPQLIVAANNSEVALISARLKSQNVPHEAVDARWMTERGGDAEAAFEQITKEAGGVGKILVVNMQGGRGTDIQPTARPGEGRPAHVRDRPLGGVARLDVQAIKRAGRSGAPGEFTMYNSAEDALFTDPRSGPP